MLEFNSRVLEVKVNGDIHKVSFPTVGQFRDFQKTVKGDLSIDDMLLFLDGLGFSKSAAEKLEPEQLNILINTLTGVEKK